MIPNSPKKDTWAPRVRRLAYDLVTGRIPRPPDGERRRRLLLGTAATAGTLSVFLLLLDLTVTRRTPSASARTASAGELSHRYRESLLDGWAVLQNGTAQVLARLDTLGPWLLLALTLLWWGHRLHGRSWNVRLRDAGASRFRC